MKAIINNESLAILLATLSDACNQRSIIPIVQNVHISVNNNVATFHQTNLNIHIVNKIECTADGDFDILIPFFEMKKITSLCTGPVTIGEKNGFAFIQSEEDVWKVGKVDDPANYPVLPEFDSAFSFKADGTFFWSLNAASTTVKTGDYSLGNVCLDISENEAVIVATDTMSMFHHTHKVISKERAKPITFAPAFTKSVSAFQESTVTVGDKYIQVESGDLKVISVLSDIGYINYSAVTATKRDPNCTVNLVDLIRAIKKVMASRSNLGFYHITFKFSKDLIKMSFKENDKEVHLDVRAETDIESTVKLNAENLLNSLSQIPPTVQDIKLSIAGESSVVFIYPADSDELLLMVAPIVNQQSVTK